MSKPLSNPATDVRATTGTALRRPNSTLIVIYLALGGLSFAVLQSLVAPALSTIGKDLNVS
ncbi:MAG: transporter, partial [Microbacteriaceae bacterium]|nr:transporter [Microbacteriaceae bacterium]